MGEGPCRCGVLVVGAATALLLPCCNPTFRGAVTQPNPTAAPTETLRTSEPVVVITGDMDLNLPVPADDGSPASVMHMRRYPLRNQAQFTVVSRDRLRFHVQVEHKWQEWADLNNWTATLEDDRGHKWQPEGLDHATTTIITQMWDWEQRSVRTNQFRDIVGINDDGWKRREPLGNLSVFRGRGDFVFYQRDLLAPNVRWLKLTIHHSGESFEFTWDFADDVATADADFGN
jgi:hypothetical protein